MSMKIPPSGSPREPQEDVDLSRPLLSASEGIAGIADECLTPQWPPNPRSLESTRYPPTTARKVSDAFHKII